MCVSAGILTLQNLLEPKNRWDSGRSAGHSRAVGKNLVS